MPFPSIVTTAVTTAGSTAATACVCALPSGIVAGNLLVVVFRSASSASVTWPAGWTEAIDSAADASDDCFSIGWRRADGLTDGTTVTVTSSASAKFAATAYRINDWAQSINPVFTTVATGTSTTPNPGAATISATKDYLFLWTGGWEGEQTSPPAGNPTNYGLNPIGSSSGTAGVVATNCRVAMAGRQLNTGVNEDPPTWTISASDDWMAVTVTVHPGANLAVNASNGVSSMSGDMTNTKHLEAVTAGVSSLTGDLTVETAGGPVDLGTVTCNGTSSLSTGADQPNVSHPLEATSNGVSSLSTGVDQPNVTHPLEAVSNGASAISAGADQPNVTHPLDAVTAGTSSLSTGADQPNVIHSLASVTNGVSSMTGILMVVIDLGTVTSNGVSSLNTGADQPNVAHSLDVISNGVSSLSTNAEQPNVTHPLEASTAGVSSITGTLSVVVDLGTDTSNGVSSLNSAMLNVAVALDGTSNGVSSLSTDVTQPNVSHPLEASTAGISSLTGDLTVVIAGIDLGTVTANGVSAMGTGADQPNVSHPLDVGSAGTSLITGTLGVTIDLGGGTSNGVSTLDSANLTVGVASEPGRTFPLDAVIISLQIELDVILVNPSTDLDVVLVNTSNELDAVLI